MDSDSESSVISAASPRKSTLPPLLTDLTGPNKPRGLFDEDSDDDGDLFGVSRKPSISSVTHGGSRASISQPPQLPESRRQSAVSFQQTEASAESEQKSTPGPVSFLDELRKKTGQRNAGDQRDVKSPSTPTVLESEETLPTPSKPQQTQQPPAQKRQSIFDSDSESDIFATKPKPPRSVSETLSSPRSRSGTELSNAGGIRQLSNDSQHSEKLPTNERSKKPTLLDSDSEEEAFPPDARKQSLPKINSPLAGATQVLPKLPKRNSLFDDSDSDSDIFGPPKRTAQKAAVEKPKLSEPIPEADEPVQVVKPKEFKGVRVLPQIPVKLKTKEVEEATTPPTPKAESTTSESKRSQALPVTSLESVVKPQTSESEDEGVKPGVKKPATRPQQLPAKLPNLFGDSDSDEDLFGASPIVPKLPGIGKADKKPETVKKVPEVPYSDELSRKLSSKKSPALTPSSESSKPKTPGRTPSASLFADPLASTESEAVQTSQKPLSAPEEEVVEIRESHPAVEAASDPKKEESPALKRPNIFSADSDSDEDPTPLTVPTTAKTVAVEGGPVKKAFGDPVTETPQAPDENLESATVDSKRTSVGNEETVLESLVVKDSDSTSPTEEEPVKSMADKTSSVKKIGMGLPAGLLQGLKARQQQLGIAQPERKRDETTSEPKTPDAQPATMPPQSSSGDSGLVAMKSDHKDVVEIAKNRVKGPSGRRLPTRSTGVKKSEAAQISEKDEPRVESAQIKTEAVETQQSIPENSISESPEDVIEQTDSAKSEPVTQPTLPTPPQPSRPTEQEAAQNPRSVEDVSALTTVASKPPSAPKTDDEPKESAKPSRPKSKSIFASDSSDEDLFAPKAPPRRKSLPKEPVAVARPTATSLEPVEIDPLSTAFSTAAEKLSDDEPTQPVAPKRAPKSTIEKAEKKDVEAPNASSTTPVPTSTTSKSLFSDSEDDDDAPLFGSKTKTKAALPKSATTSALASAKEKPKITQSKSMSTNLFGSDSDSDDLFKKK